MKKLGIISIILSVMVVANLSGQSKPFGPGENLSYYIHYGFLSGGVADLELKADTIFGRDVLYAKLSGRTTGMADAIYKVRDYYHSYFDPESLLPYKAIRDISEGRYRRYNELLFDHVSRSDSAIIESKRTGRHIAQLEIYDILSCFYFMRDHYLSGEYELKEEEIITIVTWFADELYPIRLRFKGYETIKTPVGRIECLVFNPVTEVGRLFKTEDDMTVWFSNDENYLPVKIRFDIFVGRVTVDLERYEGLGWPLNITKK